MARTPTETECGTALPARPQQALRLTLLLFTLCAACSLVSSASTLPLTGFDRNKGNIIVWLQQIWWPANDGMHVQRTGKISTTLLSAAVRPAYKFIPPVCSLSTLSKIISAHPKCAEPIRMHLTASVNVFTYGEKDQTDDQKRACAAAFRDPGNMSIDNDGITENITIVQKIKLYWSAKAQTNFIDLDAYLKRSNPKERQHRYRKHKTHLHLKPKCFQSLCIFCASCAHVPAVRFVRLLCKLEGAQQSMDAQMNLGTSQKATEDKAVADKNMKTWSVVMAQQQQYCDVFANTDWLDSFDRDGVMPTGLSKWRTCLRSLTDQESAELLQCRAKDADSRSLFEVRDFMCLHGDKASRDKFYAHLSGRSVSMDTTQKYEVYKQDHAGANVYIFTTLDASLMMNCSIAVL